MISTTHPAALGRYEPSTHPVGIVLVATDGTHQSDGALRVAIAHAAERGVALHVLTVVQDPPLLAPEPTAGIWSEPNMIVRDELRASIRAQLRRVTGRDDAHAITVLTGNPAYGIARAAIEQRAALVVAGLGRHKVRDRMFSAETALQLARISRVPVLAVPGDASAVPTHAVVAVDFSDLSLRAAREAIALLGGRGVVELVHAMPYVLEDAFTLSAVEPYERWVGEQLQALLGELGSPAGIELRCQAIRGRPAPELLAYAGRVHADLIVTGTHGLGFVARSLLGSVTSQVIRSATCAVLTIPRDPLPARGAPEGDAAASPRAEAAGWMARLAEFTARNVGRRTILEVDDIEIGAQSQEHNYPLIAALYDERDHRVQIMLGDRTPTGRHLSRSIGSVSAVDVLVDEAGHDLALRIEHGTGQTLLTFAP